MAAEIGCPETSRSSPVRGIQYAEPSVRVPQLREFALMILSVTNDRGRHVHRRNCDRCHTFYTRTDPLQLAAEFLSMPNDWLRSEFKALLVSAKPLSQTLAISFRVKVT